MGIADDNLLKVYVRLPVIIKEEYQIKSLHQDIESVKLPRQKTRWCIATFRTAEDLQSAIEHLRSLKIDGKPIVAKRLLRKTDTAVKKPPRRKHIPIKRINQHITESRLSLLDR